MRIVVFLTCFLVPWSVSAQVAIHVEQPMTPPAWALLERAVLKANADGAREFAGKYLDDRGFLRCIERWGGLDGPDDAMENFWNWTLAHALGSPDIILSLYDRAWEGHLQQYTKARVKGIPMAESGMYYREFVTSFDWEHNGEGLSAFHFYSLCRPQDPVYRKRLLRYAGFYTGEDPEAQNYDRARKIIRSLHNGSRGPKLTPATPMDWGGEAVPGDTERHENYKTAANIVGDHPLNLCAATLGMNAYMLTQDKKYRDWLIEYVGAWRERVEQNGGNIPTNIGLDGRIGGEWGGKWYGGVFGWNFWPQTGSRNYYIRGPRMSFGEAFMLTKDERFIDAMRHQIDNLYAAKKVENGRILLPNKYGDNGWYGYSRDTHSDVQRDIYLWSMNPKDMDRIASDPWISYLEGRNPDYPAQALGRELDGIRRRVKGLRDDPSTPDTRGSDYSQGFNPVATDALTNLTAGGNDPGSSGNILHSRVRYFDPARRRAGLPEDVAALVEKIRPADIVLTLVNTNPVDGRELIVQMGAYGEHHSTSISLGDRNISVDSPLFRVRLAPGAGASMTIRMNRYTHTPSLAFPWDR